VRILFSRIRAALHETFPLLRIDLESLPAPAKRIGQIGFELVEVSGEIWNHLVRSEEEQVFPPVPAPESRPRRPAVRALALNIPVILVGRAVK